MIPAMVRKWSDDLSSYAAPAIVPLAPAIFSIVLSIVFCRWALGESKRSPSAVGYWVLCGITGLIGATVTLTLGYFLLEDAVRKHHAGEIAAVFGVSLFIGLVAALLFVGVLRMLASLLRPVFGNGVKEKNSASDAKPDACADARFF